MNGFLNVLKPPGMTSAAVVANIRHLSGEKRVGHAGTLDPEACGVLPVMLGRAARLFDYLVDKEKGYTAEVAFGQATDTQDATGMVIAEGTDYPARERIAAAALKLTGDVPQRPGMYSAIKLDGKPMYERARRGQVVEVPERIVHIDSITLGEALPEHGMLLTVRCGRGTYIRSLCEDLGRLTGCPAHMRFLLRTKSGAFDLSSAVTMEEIIARAAEGRLSECLLPMDMPLGHMHRVLVPETFRKQVINGAKVPWTGDTEPGQVTRVYLADGFWGIAENDGNQLVWRAQMPPDL